MNHSTACRAHAIGCAVENIRDMEPGLPEPIALEPITVGDGYLVDGTASCLCRDSDEALVPLAPWIIRGLAVLDAAAR